MRRWVPYAVLATFIAMLALGIGFGEFGTVLANAVTICLSCIGIG